MFVAPSCCSRRVFPLVPAKPAPAGGSPIEGLRDLGQWVGSGMRSANFTENITVVPGRVRAPDRPTGLRSCPAHRIWLGINKIALGCGLPLTDSWAGSELPTKPRCVLESIDTQITFLSPRSRIWIGDPSSFSLGPRPKGLQSLAQVGRPISGPGQRFPVMLLLGAFRR